jgi:cell division transport system ATP-binding protein
MIHFKNVSLAYPDGTVALKDINLHIDDGEFVFLMGHSGAGKTSLTKLLLCEEKLSAGSIEVNGYRLDKIRSRKIPYLRRTMGVVFQDFKLFDKMTVYENVAFAMRVIGAREREIKERVPYVLELVGLADKSKRHPSELSGGEQQRLAIARALVNNPSMIIADEPTGNLDPQMSFEIMSLLEEINNLGTTMLVVTHAQNLVDSFNKRVITINDGVIVDDGLEAYYSYEA